MGDNKIRDFQTLYDGIIRYVKWLAGHRSSDHILMQPDELEGELLYECWKGWLHYGERDLTEGELKAIVRKMMDNRIGELYARYYHTHRKHEAHLLDIDDEDVLIVNTDLSMENSAATYVDSCERFAMFVSSLTDDEYDVVRAVLQPDFRIYQQVMLESWRKKFVYNGREVITITPNMVANALHMDKKYVKHLWENVRQKWRVAYVQEGKTEDEAEQ